ncbi:MAG: hypothetical protein HC897_15215 [Thermoanaerobaculia bacterium]|nr:hypothetical protein [Thermoanaerobaculia bacterium]
MRRAPAASNPHRIRIAILVLGLSGVLAHAATATETDPFTGRLTPIADSTEQLDAHVNGKIEALIAGWRFGRDEIRFENEVYRVLGGAYWVDKIERWTRRNPEVEKLPRPRRGIYTRLPLWSFRVGKLVSLSPTLKLCGELVGTDKLSHFFSHGFKYHQRFRRGLTTEEVARYGPINEGGFYGQTTTGVYSNGDVVSSYEGFLFYRGLFTDGVVAAKPALLGWKQGRPHLRRRFEWADHVTELWDEARDPSRYDSLLWRRLRHRVEALCPEFRQAPELYLPQHEAELLERYAHLGLRSGREFRMDVVCATKNLSRDPAPPAPETAPAPPGSPAHRRS